MTRMAQMNADFWVLIRTISVIRVISLRVSFLILAGWHACRQAGINAYLSVLIRITSVIRVSASL